MRCCYSSLSQVACSASYTCLIIALKPLYHSMCPWEHHAAYFEFAVTLRVLNLARILSYTMHFEVLLV